MSQAAPRAATTPRARHGAVHRIGAVIGWIDDDAPNFIARDAEGVEIGVFPTKGEAAHAVHDHARRALLAKVAT